MGRVKAGSLRLCEAAEMLGLSYRQSKRIWARYRAGGAKALQHGNCGRVSNRAYGTEFRAAVLKQVKTRYEDFGPTLACEHLASDDGLQVHAETLRRWLREAGPVAETTAAQAVSSAAGTQSAFRRTGAVGRQLSSVAGRAWAARLSGAHGGRRHHYGAGPILRGGNDLGGGRGVAPLDRTLRGTAGALHRLEERVRAAAQRAGAAERRTRRD